MGRRETDLLQGTLDMLILKALDHGPQHGYGILRWIRQVTENGLKLEEGALYPALHRIAAKGWVEADWGTSENNRQAKFYALTDRGREQLDEECRLWRSYVTAIAKVLEAV